jgi:hypothetical protein
MEGMIEVVSAVPDLSACSAANTLDKTAVVQGLNCDGATALV